MWNNRQMSYDLHLVRTLDWLDAAVSPVTCEDVNHIIENDPNLEWSRSNFVDMEGSTGTVRYYMINWNGIPCFWWYRDQVVCASPDERKTKKLVEMAGLLSAHVIGDDVEKYIMQEGLFGGKKIKILQE
jgi:hypothetical protein